MNVYIWTEVTTHSVECDFTTSDNWFTYWAKWWGNNESYGRNSNWLYCSSSYWAFVTWKIPSSVYSLWTLMKIEFQFTSDIQWCWGWIYIWWATDDKPKIRTWNNALTWYTWYTASNVTFSWNTPTSSTVTIDLENKVAKNSWYPSNTLAITDAWVTAIRDSWTAGTLYINAMRSWNVSTWTVHYWYIKKAIFYYQ